MKNLYILALSLLVIINTANAQRIDYDNTSKWYLGLNLGGTWSTTDVRDDLYAGWGLTLGRSFNYDYGRKMTFDLRARYLRGKWYGQDLSKTSLADYNPDNLVDPAQFPLMAYQDSGIVNNFQADVHRLGFELVLHANGIRERSGWDPYIFGGVGFTWYQTYGDLYSNDSLSGSYNYSADNYSKTEISDIIDGVYDSPLVGSTKDKFSVDFMPSLGIGLGYQIGKRTTFGIEHKTTFTLNDHFDGYVDQSSKIKNDLYHYTSLYLQFRFKVRGNTTVTDDNNIENIDNYSSNPNCDLPKVVFINPSANDQLSAGQSFVVTADLNNVINRDNITFLFNGSVNTNFSYNSSNGRFESTVVLVNGSNSFEITATNTCGNASNSISVNYQSCVNPIINWSSPSVNNSTVSVANFNLSALVQNSTNGQGITLTQNGRAITNVNFNGTTGALTSSVTLTPGANVFVLTATNACGTDTETITINFQSCVNPTVSLTSPTVNNLAVTSPNFNLSALIQNSTNGQGVTLSQNGRAITNFSFNNSTGALSSNITLNQGANTFVITVVNACGTDTETITVNYQNCLVPTINWSAPSANNTTVTSANFNLSALIQNSNNGQGISLTNNGRGITNFSFNNATGSLTSNVTLVPGSNIFVITVTNACGTDTETITVNYQNCVAPTVSFVTPSTNNTTVTSANFNLSAFIQNSNNGQGITLTNNGRGITNFSFNNATGSLTSNVTLVPGSNIFVITVTNACGTDTETITVNYQNCVAPVVNFVTPSSNNTTVTSASFSLSALVQNSANGQTINLTKNGISITDYNFNNATGVLTSTVPLAPGANVFVITVTNACGTDSKTITVNYQNCVAPIISFVAPSANNTTVTSAAFNLSAIVQNSNNGEGITLTNNGRGITNFSVNSATGALTSNVTLVPGANVFVITVTNACGTATETITVNYQNCVAPTVSFVAPSANNTTVTSAGFNLSAIVQNSNNGQGITLTNNGRGITNFSVNSATGALTSNVTLVPGANVFVITVTNACGTATETITVNYQNCVAPTVSFVAPSANNTTVTSAGFNLSAIVQNSNSGQGITLTNNGRGITNFSVNSATGALTSNVTLVPGANVFVITVTNACGTATETITVNYQNCVAPTVSFVAPSANNTTVTSAGFNLSAIVQNSNNGQGITLTNNGRGITNFSVNSATGALTSNVTLVPGANVFVITVTNACGTATETITVNYQNCVAPTVSFVAPSSNNTTVTSAGFNLSAIVQNSNSGQGITLTNNGRGITTFSVNNATGALTSNVTLVPGANVFVITVTNACGTETETITVNYQNCVAPTVSFVAPSSNNTTVTSAGFNLSAIVQNSNNGQGIALTNNGRGITTFSVNNATGALTSNVTLVPGANVFVITVTNACGTATETITVNYQNCVAPTVTFINPSSSPINVSSPNYNLNATVLNSNNGEGIAATQNGKLITSGSFNPANGSLTGTVVLNQGANIFVVTVTNACGTATETVTIFYQEEEENNSNPEQMITICYTPQGDRNPQTIEIPLSQWPSYQGKGAVLGPCSEEPAGNDNNGQGSNSNNDENSNGSGFGGIGNAGNGSGSSNGNSGNGNNGSSGGSGGDANGSNGDNGNNSNNQPKEPQIIKPKGVTPKGGTTPAPITTPDPKTPVKEPVKETEPEEKLKEKEVPVEESTPPPPLKGRGGK